LLMAGKIELDELDRLIIAELNRDGRKPFTAIAKKAGVAEATIRKRVERLQESGILKIKAIVDPLALGYKTSAIIGIRVEGSDIKKTLAALQQMQEIRYIGIATGNHDIIVEAFLKNGEDLYPFLTKRLREVPGVVSTDTSLIMKIVQDRPDWISIPQGDRPADSSRRDGAAG